MKASGSKQISNESSVWWIIIPKLKKRNASEIITKSFKEAISLENQLGRIS
jgi:hypothetical protein